MKIYIDHGNVLELEGLFIPKDVTNRHYQQFLEEQNRNEIKIIPYKKPPVEWDAIRAKRNRLLSDSDWSQLPDAPLNQQEQTMWKNYRQTLRDLPEIFSDPTAIIWPEQPSTN